MRRAIILARRALAGTRTRHDHTNAPSPLTRGTLVATALTLAVMLPVTFASTDDVPPGLIPVRTDLTPEDQARVTAVTKPTTNFSKAEGFELMQGGAGTSRKRVNADAFSQFSANITFEEEATFKLGNALFRKLWVSSPSSTQASDGLGPLFNARACQSCHLKDGRGHPPEGAADATSMFLRLAREAETEEERIAVADKVALNFPDPVYGGQLQDLAVPGLVAEGKMKIDYTEAPFAFADGTIVSLRKPTYSIENLSHGPLNTSTTLSPRVSPQMIGLGLVEQIHPADILALADPDDRDGDGISGRPNIVREKVVLRSTKTGELTLGRFGWKAEMPAIRQQSADAFAGDIGISSPDAPRNWGDCTQAETECLAMPTGVQERLGDTEAPDPILDLVTFYSQNLAVPARRDVDDAEVLRGKKAFYETGCASCHTPKFVTRRDAPNKAQAFQLIWPYSDFLLHDMGEGLADGQRVGDASGNEWRTAPLWGIGLTETVNDHTFFLHDGRARNLTEAILWHGGEAEKARDGFAVLPKRERDALIKFLESL
ncbi:MAG TPA: di-heme oxidoredictase family protein [Rhizobiaceae bacterium]|nr:di-heme oxidoredictase family protein [Rhizobiaceae bacterium]